MLRLWRLARQREERTSGRCRLWCAASLRVGAAFSVFCRSLLWRKRVLRCRSDRPSTVAAADKPPLTGPGHRPTDLIPKNQAACSADCPFRELATHSEPLSPAPRNLAIRLSPPGYVAGLPVGCFITHFTDLNKKIFDFPMLRYRGKKPQTFPQSTACLPTQISTSTLPPVWAQGPDPCKPSERQHSWGVFRLDKMGKGLPAVN